MPDPADPSKPRPTRRQMNVRLPTDLIAQIDVRRAHKDLSRDQFVERALRFALANNPPRTPVPTTRRQRTIRP